MYRLFAVVSLLFLTSASAQECVVSPAEDLNSAIDVMFDPIKIVSPVEFTGTKQWDPAEVFSVPIGSDSLTFEYRFCSASETTFQTPMGDEVRHGTIPPIFVIESGRTVTGNIIGIGPQQGDLTNWQASITRTLGDSFSVTDAVTFDISSLAPGDYSVQVWQALPLVDANSFSIHPEGDMGGVFWFTSAIMTIPVPEPSGSLSFLGALVLLSGRRNQRSHGVRLSLR